jgi:anionic cell wall polymer biosynthesis LytR-Cps2A-Psr (LCP) family protein
MAKSKKKVMILIIILIAAIATGILIYYMYTKHNSSYTEYANVDPAEVEKAKAAEKAQQDFINQHKKKDISTYEWSYLMRYRDDATDAEIFKTLSDNLNNMTIFENSRDNIFIGDQFRCYYDTNIVLDNGDTYKYDYIIDLDDYVVYAYVWRV